MSILSSLLCGTVSSSQISGDEVPPRIAYSEDNEKLRSLTDRYPDFVRPAFTSCQTDEFRPRKPTRRLTAPNAETTSGLLSHTLSFKPRRSYTTGSKPRPQIDPIMPTQSEIIAGKVRSKLQKLTWFPRNLGKEILQMCVMDTLMEEIRSETQYLEDGEVAAFKEFIFEEAPQLCTMLIRFKAIELIGKFYRCGIVDSDFPLHARLDEEDPNQIHITHPQTTLEVDDLDSDRLFFSDSPSQHQFFVPVLEWKAFNDASLKGKLPYLFEPKAISSTDFSIVRKSTVHHQHIDIEAKSLKIEVDEDNNPLVAIKELLRTTMTSSQFDTLVRLEYSCLSRLRSPEFDTPHLIRAAAFYRKGDSLFFVFPWAPHGNLLNFWEKRSPRPYDQKYVKWLFGQLLGLTRTVQCLHDSQVTIRHGDLKPENILCFESSDSEIQGEGPSYVLVISDVGLAKEHERLTQYRSRTKQPGGATMVYAAPEIETHENRATSRRYDIWSLGCIYLEFMTWLLLGFEGRQRYSGRKQGKFYRIQDDKNALRPGDNMKIAEVDPDVQDWISEMISRSRTAQNKSTAVSSMLEVIRDRLLVIDANPDYFDLRSPDQDEAVSMSSVSPDSTSESIDLSTFKSTDQATSESIITPTFKLDRAQTDPTTRMSNERAYAGEICSKISEIIEQAETGQIEWVSFGEPTLPTPPASPLSSDQQALRDYEPAADGMLGTLNYSRIIGLFIDPAQLNDLSEYVPDKDASAEVVDSFTPLALARKESNLCTRCRHLPISPHDVVLEATLHVLLKGSPWCDLCRLLCHVLKGRASTPNNLMRFFRTSRYLALSHRWGTHPNPSLADQIVCAYESNMQYLARGFDDSALPPLYRDAITIARKLSINYLWIDSLCIVQAEPSNPEDKDKGRDFLKEAGKMELVFSSAYATIAATCAGSPAEHFLKPRPERHFATIPTDRGPYYLAEVIDKFSEDVDQSELNSRGWVFQERALSRRTIYFAEKQTYWECGKGIRCETLTRTENIKSALLGDANFPFSLPDFDKGRRIKLFQSLYERYTKLEFTYPTDRPIAIRGLETRLLRALDTRGGYGVFEQYMRRGLLWQRKEPSLPRIDFSKSPSSNAHEFVPSWSWMAYDGPIRYMEIPAAAEWAAWYADVRSPWESDECAKPFELRVLVRNLADFAPCDRIIFDDLRATSKHDFKCVIVGSKRAPDPMQAEVYYSLIVTPVHAGEHICQRAGVAFLERRDIDWKSPPVAMLVR
ncbi:hypothetical protein G7054_g6357 [Neopestalotiopsis clavispora]|nr:hypothetical protein G7054_g6357 [Neopestalotiopsis clavispora]